MLSRSCFFVVHVCPQNVAFSLVRVPVKLCVGVACMGGSKVVFLDEYVFF